MGENSNTILEARKHLSGDLVEPRKLNSELIVRKAEK